MRIWGKDVWRQKCAELVKAVASWPLRPSVQALNLESGWGKGVWLNSENG